MDATSGDDGLAACATMEAASAVGATDGCDASGAIVTSTIAEPARTPEMEQREKRMASVSVTDLQMDALSDVVTKEMSVEIFRVATALSAKGGVSEN
jgi:hypothetical protein